MIYTCRCLAATPHSDNHRPHRLRQALLACEARRKTSTGSCGFYAAHRIQHGECKRTLLVPITVFGVLLLTVNVNANSWLHLRLVMLSQAVSPARRSDCSSTRGAWQWLWLRKRPPHRLMRQTSRAWAPRRWRRCVCWSGPVYVRTLRASRPPRLAGKPRWSSRSALPATRSCMPEQVEQHVGHSLPSSAWAVRGLD